MGVFFNTQIMSFARLLFMMEIFVFRSLILSLCSFNMCHSELIVNFQYSESISLNLGSTFPIY